MTDNRSIAGPTEKVAHVSDDDRTPGRGIPRQFDLQKALEREEANRQRHQGQIDVIESRNSGHRVRIAELQMELGRQQLDIDRTRISGTISSLEATIMANEANILMYRGFIDASHQETARLNGRSMPGMGYADEPGSRNADLPTYPEPPAPLRPPPPGQRPWSQPSPREPDPRLDPERIRREQESMKPDKGSLGFRISEWLYRFFNRG